MSGDIGNIEDWPEKNPLTEAIERAQKLIKSVDKAKESTKKSTLFFGPNGDK